MASDDKKEASKTTQQPPPPTQPYTVFTTGQRRYLTYFLGYLTLASSLTATIYFPLIGLLSTRYSVSVQAINLSITLYVIFQAIAPAFWAPIYDTLGRRPIFLATFVIYCAASLGLALNRTSYVALLLLRALQSIGGSAVMSLAYGVAADISPHFERGRILGPMLSSTNLGPCIGPVIRGGAILASGDPQWCFWALLIFGASSLLLIAWTMPETARTVVGNVTLQMFSALLVDIFPNKAGAAGAANNITRSALSAAVVAVLQPLVDAIGRGWFFTLIGLIDGVFGIIAVQFLKRWGQSWRRKRET